MEKLLSRAAAGVTAAAALAAKASESARNVDIMVVPPSRIVSKR